MRKLTTQQKDIVVGLPITLGVAYLAALILTHGWLPYVIVGIIGLIAIALALFFLCIISEFVGNVLRTDLLPWIRRKLS